VRVGDQVAERAQAEVPATAAFGEQAAVESPAVIIHY